MSDIGLDSRGIVTALVVFQLLSLLPLVIVALVLAFASRRRKVSAVAFMGGFGIASLLITIPILILPFGPFFLPAIAVALTEHDVGNGGKLALAAINTGYYLIVGLLGYRFAYGSIAKTLALAFAAIVVSFSPVVYTVAFAP